MATYEIKPQWLDYSEIRELHTQQVRLGLSVSLEERRGWFGRTFVFTGAPENIEVWKKALLRWEKEQQSSMSW